MLRLAIVEDTKEDSDKLLSFIERYSESNNLVLETKCFKNPVLLVDDYSSRFDVIFLDIKMPMMNGMDAAKIIREKDKNVIIIFITSLAQYAVEGYQVDALDFIVKPIEYNEFSLKFNRALLRVHQEKKRSISVNIGNNVVRLDIDSILYVESRNHKAIFHTETDQYSVRETLTTAEQLLFDSSFSRCNNCYLVNLKYVLRIEGNECVLPKERLLISRPKKKAFQDSFVRYLEG